MEHTELSLRMTNSSSSSLESELESISARKRKEHIAWSDPAAVSQNIDLQLNDPLPLDWEQCLDLQSGSMYYLNRKTMKRSWVKPKEQSMNLELNISPFAGAEGSSNPTSSAQEWMMKKQYSSSSGNMVALVCVNCHLLVMLCKSSPACPNCKYLHSLDLSPPHWKLEAAEPLETLSLLH